jgi:hypothetical protein
MKKVSMETFFLTPSMHACMEHRATRDVTGKPTDVTSGFKAALVHAAGLTRSYYTRAPCGKEAHLTA